MSHYETVTGPEGDFAPGSHALVLKNKLGISNKDEMDQREFIALTAAQQLYLKKITVATRFTAALILEMHREWLGEIYVWAGRYRTVELAKKEFRWPPAHRVPDLMKDFEATILKQYTPGRGDAEEVADAMARVHAELLLIHPFRDGNGRIARWIADLMALQAGFPLPKYNLGRERSRHRKEYIAAVGQGYLMNYAPLASFFGEALERARD